MPLGSRGGPGLWGVRREEFFCGLLVGEESEAPRAGAGGVVAELPGSLFNSQDTCLWP